MKLRYLARSVIVVLPYFPTGTMERVEEEGQIATAATLARVSLHPRGRERERRKGGRRASGEEQTRREGEE